MAGTRLLPAASIVFAAGLVTAALRMDRYRDAYAWVAHTTDVRVVIDRAIGNASSDPSCVPLRDDVADLRRLTADNPSQQALLPGLGTSVDEVCARRSAPTLIDQRAALDANERALIGARRRRLEVARR